MRKCKYCGGYFLFSSIEKHEEFCLMRPLGDIDLDIQNIKNFIFEDTPQDNINPDHYKKGGIETFDYMKAKMSPEQLEGYLMGNILKYVSRYQFKNGVEDLKKSQWYLEKLIELKG